MFSTKFEDINICEPAVAKTTFETIISNVALAIITVVNFIVIFGNFAVIAAVFFTRKLKTVTNYFVVSLAFSDLLAGIFVMPFGVSWEIYKVWLFGETWCLIWLFIDVWMCTASVFHLCIISMDRYYLITRPLKYHSIVTTHRAKLVILGVWILSLGICFPPLLIWKGSGLRIITCNNRQTEPLIPPDPTFIPPDPTLFPPLNNIDPTNPAVLSSSTAGGVFDKDLGEWNFSRNSQEHLTPKTFDCTKADMQDLLKLSTGQKRCIPSCELTSHFGYIIYASITYILIPSIFISFSYGRICFSAIGTSKAIHRGYRTTRIVGGEHDGERLTLRIHRGRGSARSEFNRKSTTFTGRVHRSPSGTLLQTTKLTKTRSSTNLSKPEGKRKSRNNSPRSEISKSGIQTTSFIEEPIPSTSTAPIPGTSTEAVPSTSDGRRDLESTIIDIEPPFPTSDSSSERKSSFPSPSPSQSPSPPTFPSPSQFTPTPPAAPQSPPSKKSGARRRTRSKRFFRTRNFVYSLRYIFKKDEENNEQSDSLEMVETCTSEPGTSTQNSESAETNIDEIEGRAKTKRSTLFTKLMKKAGSHQFKDQLRKLKWQAKAAKSLGLIVGAFILFWTPFFIVYMVRGFCARCIGLATYTGLFWLGYCNSAVNPCLYALSCQDFRDTFRKFINKYIRRIRPDDVLNVRKNKREGFGARLKNLYTKNLSDCCATAEEV